MPSATPSAAQSERRLPLSRPPLGKGSAALIEWLIDLRTAGVRQAGPALVVALESLRSSRLSPSRRFDALRLMKRPVLKTCASLPKPWNSASGGGAETHRGMSLEQRLYRLMFQNLNELLHGIDRRYFILDGRQARRRVWVVRNLFRYFDRLSRYCALWDCPMPESAWREMHDLSLYLAARRGLREEGNGVVYLSEIGMDPALEYKRMLLLGLAAELAGPGAGHPAMRAGVRAWAGETRLLEPDTRRGAMGLFLVEIAQDSPPRQEQSRLDTGLRGWVLEPPKAYLELLNRILCGEQVEAPPRPVGWRPASGMN